ncbi:MAG TPA: class I adenylate-forming enzyme family protein, partial [Clostridia bacterium]|nr:class I adenylate-forming enzyme family protein [Clostridia bacterium]
MLYQRWLETVRATGPQTALTDMAAGRSWTFQALANEAERGAPASEPVLFADATGAGFILAVLRAWRAGRILCPLEPGQLPPGLTTGLPAGIAHLKFTSASTGTPRVVALTGAQMAADADNIVASMGLRPDWPNIGVISLAHSYGFSNLVLPLLLHGIPLILAEAALPEALRRAAANQSCVTLAAVPALWRAWLEAGSIPPNIKLAISAGAPLPLPLEVAVFDRHRLKIHNFYGSSETGGIAFDGSAEPRTDAAFVGSPMANVQVALAEDGCV